MNGDEKTRNTVRRAVVELRNALGLTQQKFAGVLNTAVTTIARYETSHPPSGKALLRLAEIAHEKGLLDLSGQFRLMYLDEVLDDEYWSEPNVRWWSPAEGSPHGYLLMKFSGDDQLQRALKAYEVLMQPSRGSPRKSKSQRDRRSER
jgi:transcriptional regulator with XRE-family HTH domain